MVIKSKTAQFVKFKLRKQMNFVVKNIEMNICMKKINLHFQS